MEKIKIVSERLGLTAEKKDAFTCTAEVHPDYALPEFTLPEEIEGLKIDTFKIGGNMPQVIRKICLPKSVESVIFNNISTCARYLEIEIDEENPYLFWDGKAVYTRQGELVRFCAGSCKTYAAADNTSSIGAFAFAGMKNLRRLELPDGLERIEYKAFSGCDGLTELNIPESVTKISDYAFNGMSVRREIKVAEGNRCFTSENGIIYSKDKTRLLFAYAPEARVIVPDSVCVIGNAAFMQSPVEEITLPPNLSEIGDSAFLGCTRLKSIDLEGVRTVGASAFTGCTGLESVSLTCVDIPEKAFAHCATLKNVTLENTRFIGRCAFFICQSLERLVLPEGLEVIEDEAFYADKKLSISLPCSVLDIGRLAFDRVRELELPEICEMVIVADRIREVIADFRGIGTLAVRGGAGEILFKISAEFQSSSDSVILEAAMSGYKEFGFDFEEYDRVLANSLRNSLSPHLYSDEKEKAAFLRLEYPMGLSENARAGYLEYLRYNAAHIVRRAVRENNFSALELCMRLGLFTSDNIGVLIDEAAKLGRTEFTAALLEYKNRRFPGNDTELKLD